MRPQSDWGLPVRDRYPYQAAVAEELWKNQFLDPMWTLLQVLLRLEELVRTRLAK